MSVVVRQKALNFAAGERVQLLEYRIYVAGRDREAGEREIAEGVYDGADFCAARYDEDAFSRRSCGGYQASGVWIFARQGALGIERDEFRYRGATSLFTTVEDLALWDENFYTQKVGGPKFTETMLTHDPLTNGEKNSYAFGLVTEKYRGLDAVDHSGADAGYRSDCCDFRRNIFRWRPLQCGGFGAEQSDAESDGCFVGGGIERAGGGGESESDVYYSATRPAQREGGLYSKRNRACCGS